MAEILQIVVVAEVDCRSGIGKPREQRLGLCLLGARERRCEAVFSSSFLNEAEFLQFDFGSRSL
jgi:hypothetical protein